MGIAVNRYLGHSPQLRSSAISAEISSSLWRAEKRRPRPQEPKPLVVVVVAAVVVVVVVAIVAPPWAQMRELGCRLRRAGRCRRRLRLGERCTVRRTWLRCGGGILLGGRNMQPNRNMMLDYNGAQVTLANSLCFRKAQSHDVQTEQQLNPQ
jgi:hypothetical protein